MLLVLDTCFDACSAALYDDVQGIVASRYEAMQRGHAEALGPMVQQLFANAGVTPGQLTRIVVTNGPGTFTGLRIGLSFAKGMSLALNIPLIGIDSLTATAVPHFGSKDRFAIALPAGGTGLHYWALFDGKAARQIAAPGLAGLADIVHEASDILSGYRPESASFAAYAATLPITNKTVEPLYLRQPDAKPSVPLAISNTQVRMATAEDIPALADIHRQSFAKGWTERDLSSILSLPGATAMVVDLMGTTYGFVQVQWVAGEAEINTICVLPNYRRQHFGRDLLQGLIAHLQQMGTTKLFLEVAENNRAALGLYESFGFQISGLRKGYYSNGENAVIMVRELVS